MSRTLIICIGNSLVADDGVGHAIYLQLRDRVFSGNVRICHLGLGGMTLVEEFDGEDLVIIVDAVQFGKRPGEISLLEWSEIPENRSHVSCHGIGVREAVEITQRLYPKRAPERIFLLGVEGICFDQLGKGLSPEVENSLGEAVEKIHNLITMNSW